MPHATKAGFVSGGAVGARLARPLVAADQPVEALAVIVGGMVVGAIIFDGATVTAWYIQVTQENSQPNNASGAVP